MKTTLQDSLDSRGSSEAFQHSQKHASKRQMFMEVQYLIATMVHYAICNEEISGIHLLESRNSIAGDRILKLKVSAMREMFTHQKEVSELLINSEQPYAFYPVSVTSKIWKR